MKSSKNNFSLFKEHHLVGGGKRLKALYRCRLLVGGGVSR
jgi:hypothetical protein